MHIYECVAIMSQYYWLKKQTDDSHINWSFSNLNLRKIYMGRFLARWQNGDILILGAQSCGTVHKTCVSLGEKGSRKARYFYELTRVKWRRRGRGWELNRKLEHVNCKRPLCALYAHIFIALWEFWKLRIVSSNFRIISSKVRILRIVCTLAFKNMSLTFK